MGRQKEKKNAIRGSTAEVKVEFLLCSFSYSAKTERLTVILRSLSKNDHLPLYILAAVS